MIKTKTRILTTITTATLMLTTMLPTLAAHAETTTTRKTSISTSGAWTQLGGNPNLQNHKSVPHFPGPSIAVTPSGSIVAGGRGVSEWNGSTWTQLGGNNGVLNTNTSDPNYQRSYNVSSVAVAPSGAIVAGTWNDGVFEWNGSKWTQLGENHGYLQTNKSDPYWNGSSMIQSITVTPRGAIVAGTDSDGVFEWNGSRWIQLGGNHGYLNPNKSYPNDPYYYHYLYSSVIDSVIVTRSGAIVAGTDGDGVFKWNGSRWIQLGDLFLQTNKSDHHYFGSCQISSVAVTRSGAIIAGTGGAAGSDGVFEWNGSNWTQLGKNYGYLQTNKSDPNYKKLTNVSSVAVAPSGAIVAGTWNDGVFEWNGSKWTQLGGYYLQTNKNAFYRGSTFIVPFVAVTPRGAIVAGTDGGGVFEWKSVT